MFFHSLVDPSHLREHAIHNFWTQSKSYFSGDINQSSYDSHGIPYFKKSYQYFFKIEGLMIKFSHTSLVSSVGTGAETKVYCIFFAQAAWAVAVCAEWR